MVFRFKKIAIIIIVVTVLLNFAEYDSFAKTVKDQLGRKISVPDNPCRIVSLAPSITEIIFALNQGHLLKGATLYSDYPREAATLPKVGSYVRLDLERIVALNPDLCIAIKDGNPKDVIDRLESLKIPIYSVNPRNLETVMDTVLEIGEIIGASSYANALVASMKSRIEGVKSLVAKVDHRPKVFFQIGISPIVSVGTVTFIHELIEFAGGQNVAAGLTPYPRFNREQVLALSPDVVIITSMARAVVFEDVKAEWNRWPYMPAARNQRIFIVDSNLFDRPTPRLVDGLELLIKLIHPELFEKTR
jgi:iron complex transport system substrate-binding protein